MKYRLVRFSAEKEVIFDKECMAPNQFGCNHQWLEENPDHFAILIELRSSAQHYFYLNKDLLIPVKDRRYMSTWLSVEEEKVLGHFQYLKMLKLTGAL